MDIEKELPKPNPPNTVLNRDDYSMLSFYNIVVITIQIEEIT